MYRVSIELQKRAWKFGRTRNVVGFALDFCEVTVDETEDNSNLNLRLITVSNYFSTYY